MPRTTEPTRSLDFSWEDPNPSRAALRALGGLESIRAIQDGRIPPMPFAQVMGLSIPHAERGRVTFAFTPSELWENPMGTLHGGAIGTLLDSAMGMAVLSTLDQGVSFTTLEYKVNSCGQCSQPRAKSSPRALSCTRASHRQWWRRAS